MLTLPLLVALTAFMLASQAPLFELPAPTGKLAVGTTHWTVTDASREETFAPGRRRDIQVIAWYPADPTRHAPAPYLRNGMEEVQSFARVAKLGDVYDRLWEVRTNAALHAPPTKSLGRLPVIVFSHGYTGLPSSHTALFEDLASHGWAVLHVIHPYEATAATLADGTVVTYTDENNAFRPGIAAVFNEWGAEGSTVEKVVASTDEAEKEKLLRGYLGTLKHTTDVVTRWVLDVKYVLDHLPTSGAASALSSRLDLARLGVAGHSMGGVMAGQFCVEDRRCKAGLNYDGIPQYGTMIDRTMPAPFLMVYSGREGRLGASDLIYRRSASKYYRVDVAGTLHLDFSDMNYWGGPIAKRAFGTIGAARAAELTRLIAREYFGQEILGRKSLLLSGDSQPIEGLTVRELKK